MSPLLEVRDLQVQFNTRAGIVKAVDGISYSVAEGETVALVGESGCGKSVSALALMRLIPPPGRIVGGEVWFEGRDLLKLDKSKMRAIRGKGIAMVFQEPMTSLNPVLTIGRQIMEPIRLHLGMDGRAAKRWAVELLEMVGISDAERRLSSYPHHFSGGMRQRVMIAIALSCKPRLILADEPTTALDVTIQAQILELIKRLSQETGTAVLLITHNLGVVARYADRLNVMYAGRIVERGTAPDVYRRRSHPYTLGLLESVPRLDAPRGERLSAIEGLPPVLEHLPPGCAFRPRCPFAIERCAEQRPPLASVGNDHDAACWVSNLPDRAPRRNGIASA